MLQYAKEELKKKDEKKKPGKTSDAVEKLFGTLAALRPALINQWPFNQSGLLTRVGGS